LPRWVVSGSDLVGPVRAVSVSRSKLIVPLASESVVHELAPDYERLWSACDALSTTGVYAFARVGLGRFQARQFPLRAGVSGCRRWRSTVTF
jgi:predicted PhzF superfamily epimerase YddE/YHI9